MIGHTRSQGFCPSGQARRTGGSPFVKDSRQPECPPWQTSWYELSAWTVDSLPLEYLNLWHRDPNETDPENWMAINLGKVSIFADRCWQLFSGSCVLVCNGQKSAQRLNSIKMRFLACFAGN
jgi:hypothetical protein